MTIEERLKNLINSRYGTVLEFCNATNFKNSTLQTVFKRGVTNTSSRTIFQLCDLLSLDPASLYYGELKSSKPKKKSPSDPVDVIEYIAGMETAPLTYKGEELTDDQKKMITYGSRVAIELAVTSNRKNPDSI